MNTSLAWDTDSRVPETPGTWVFCFKNLFGGACPQTPLGSSSLRHSQGALLRPKKYRVRCFQNYVRYFKNLSKTLQYDFFLLVVRGVILSVTLRRAHEACDMASQASGKTKLSTRLSVFVWKRIFFLGFRLPTTCIRWKRSPNYASFQKRSPEWKFLKTLATRLRVDGRKRRFSNTMT